MKILVVDDEILARKRIIKLLNDINYKDNIEQASTGKEAISIINNSKPDLLFLDIQMTDMTGFDVLRKIETVKLPIIIFVTAYDTFAVQAFDVEALDFLIKPYKKERFLNAFNRALKLIEFNKEAEFNSKIKNLITFLNNHEENRGLENIKYLDKVVLKLGSRYHFVDIVDIKYITSSAYYAEIFTHNNEKHVYRISMTDFIKKLPPEMFVRINRSTIINHKVIKEVVSEGQGDYSVIMNDDCAFQLTKNYKSEFLKLMDIR
jgi:two-component system LytT family response regulator